MSFAIQKVPHESIVICTLKQGFSPFQHGEMFWSELGSAIEGEEGPIYRIMVLEIEGNFSDMVYFMAEEARGSRPGTALDPRIRVFLVGNIDLAQIAVESLKQEQYGRLNIPLFATLDEALACARAELRN